MQLADGTELLHTSVMSQHSIRRIIVCIWKMLHHSYAAVEI